MKRTKDINWNQVYYFHAVATAGSMTVAAQSLGVSLPTVSEQIKKLEAMLETRLFRRSKRRIELTENGWELFHCTREMFAAGIRFFDKVSPNSLGGYAARVGLLETGPTSETLDFFFHYQDGFKSFGSVHLEREFDSEFLWQRVMRGELDWAVGTDVPKNGRLEARELGSFDIVFCCARDVFERSEDKEEILRTLPLALRQSDKVMSQVVSQHLRSLDIVPPDLIESDYFDYRFGLAERGRCVLPLSAKDLRLRKASQVRLFTVGGPIKFPLYVAWLRSHENMIAIKQLVALLEDVKIAKASKRAFAGATSY